MVRVKSNKLGIVCPDTKLRGDRPSAGKSGLLLRINHRTPHFQPCHLIMYDSYRKFSCPFHSILRQSSYHAGPHLLLAQVPLTVSPFINLPTSVTLPYTYKSVTSTLPPSVTVDPSNPDVKARYVVSSSGEHAAHPDEILTACQSLGQHLKKTRDDAETAIKEWEESIKQRDLAEKRRVAPGWLDRDEKLLQPQAIGSPDSKGNAESLLDSAETDHGSSNIPSIKPQDQGEELDRAFGGLGVE